LDKELNMQRTVTDKMAEANRQNAQKSTGPKTEEGKARSSQNAVRHGLLSEKILLSSLPEETSEDFKNIREGLYIAHNPKSDAENLLVQRIVVCHWRLLRAFRYETYCLQAAREEAAETQPSEYILPNDRQLDRIVRYEGLIDRQLHRAITQLRQVQADRRARAQEQAAAKKAEEDNAFMRLLPDPQTFLAKVGLLTEGQVQQAVRECEEEQKQKKSPHNSAKPTSPEKPPDPSN
jgi:hypothetical protein